MSDSTAKALISVSDKEGVAPLAERIARLGFEILSTGGTAKTLREAGVTVTGVSEHTGFPEILGGRVKTLHPKIHGGILARGAQDADTLAAHAIDPLAIVVVNLYPFAKTIARPGCTFEEAVEQIDIGGPAMLRAAAKNHEHVIVLVDPVDYSPVLDELEQTGTVSAKTRRRLSARAFAHTAAYDRTIASYLEAACAEDSPEVEQVTLPAELSLQFSRASQLRYGENPHQAAAIYQADGAPGIAGFLQHAGKPLSYNNIVDTQTADGCAREIEGCACVIVKHANPCGAAIADSPIAAYERAFAADPTSDFGGIVAFNRPIDAQVLGAVLAKQFVEVIIAPAVASDALPALASKPNVRLLTPAGDQQASAHDALDIRSIAGGLLVQARDLLRVSADQLDVVTKRAPAAEEFEELLFAWTLVKWVKSNAIVYTRDGQTVGIGAGQTSRIDSARFGAHKADTFSLSLQGAVMASDAFFPFRDSIDAAAEHGIRLVIQPGGSRRDEEVIAAANEHDMAMVFTGHRHFRH
ncbi:MAG: bifunctional phosphoribosylaminoimidazolecarboxamide formyltransferase/IMP cyclohydrolase [Pseudomonadota bacterium]